MTMVDYLLWILGFLGVVIIYGGVGAVRYVSKAEVSESMQTVIKTLGVVISAAAMILLYKMGRLI